MMLALVAAILLLLVALGVDTDSINLFHLALGRPLRIRHRPALATRSRRVTTG
jgi:hypothetical protein